MWWRSGATPRYSGEVFLAGLRSPDGASATLATGLKPVFTCPIDAELTERFHFVTL